jgi:hypothetical protein
MSPQLIQANFRQCFIPLKKEGVPDVAEQMFVKRLSFADLVRRANEKKFDYYPKFDGVTAFDADPNGLRKRDVIEALHRWCNPLQVV